ncbi:MAG: CoA transferase [Dehalococcoidia bacterium]
MDLLRDFNVAVRSHTVAAAYTAWLLRQAGAEVDHVSSLDPEGIGAFLAEGARFEAEPALAAPAGVPLITDAPVTPANQDAIAARAGESLVAWITPWGAAGPWAEHPASDLGLHAAGGWMSAVGEPGKEPLGPPNGQGRLMAGLFAAVEVLALATDAVPGARRERGLLDVAVVEAVAATTIYDAVAFQYFGRIRERAGSRFSPLQPTICTLPCADGYIGIHAALHQQWLRLCDVVGHPELARDPRFAQPADRAENIAELDEYLLPWLSSRTRFQAYHALQQARIPAAALPTLDEVLASPQLAARDAWRDVTTPSGRTYRVPGPPLRIVGGAPRAGGTREDGPWRPGALRVVDLSMGWAGPLVGHILACHGADVIKVESHRRFDWWRGSRPPGDDLSLQLYERSHVFNSANRGKRGITLDLRSPSGARLVHRLIESADVVIENFGTGVMDRLGLSYDQLAQRNPELVMVRQPGFGSTGPEASYLTFGNTIEGMSGLSSLMGYAGGPPTMMSNACGDPVSGLVGTVGVLAALAARARDGRGRCIEAAQLEGFLPFVSEALIEYQRTGQLPPRAGNRRPGHVPSGAYPAAGDDQWIAVEVTTDREWAALCATTEEPWFAGRSGWSSAAREQARDEIDARLSAWTQRQSREAIVERLWAAGVPAAPLHNEADLLACEQLAVRGFFVPEERAVVGLHLYPSLPVRIDGERVLPECPAPLLGEHNVEIFANLGLDGEALRELESTGVAGRVPVDQT